MFGMAIKMRRDDGSSNKSKAYTNKLGEGERNKETVRRPCVLKRRCIADKMREEDESFTKSQPTEQKEKRMRVYSASKLIKRIPKKQID